MWACIFGAGPLGSIIQNSEFWSMTLKASIASGSRWDHAAWAVLAFLGAGVSTGVSMWQQVKLVKENN